MSSLSPSTSSTRTRLHISPLTPALFRSYISTSLQPLTTSISYHRIPTFPENDYGYITLPAMEAQKLKSKLNGATLKGRKVRIEEARPERKKRGVDGDGTGESEATKDGKTTGKRSKEGRGPRTASEREDGVLPGYELDGGRKVIRGWTEPNSAKKTKYKSNGKGKGSKEKKRKEPSRYTSQPEMLFKASVPANARSQMEEDKKGKKRKHKEAHGSTVIHEFEKTTKHPSFLRIVREASSGGRTSQYVDGKGWVDEQGNVVERERKRPRRKQVEAADHKRRGLPESLEAEEQNSMSKLDKEELQTNPDESFSSSVSSLESEQDSSSVVSSSASSTSELERAPEALPPISSSGGAPSVESKPSSAIQRRSDESRNLVQGPPMEESTPKAVHPLEALYKRPQAPNLAPINTNATFSFFGNGEESDAEDDADSQMMHVPQTPMSKQDIRERRVRSAAPTPDTAMPWKRDGLSRAPWTDDDDGRREDENYAEKDRTTPTPKQAARQARVGNADEEADAVAGEGHSAPATEAYGAEKPSESDFAKWFWEHRGESNRAWKKRRREALKAQRHRENRRLGRRVV